MANIAPYYLGKEQDPGRIITRKDIHPTIGFPFPAGRRARYKGFKVKGNKVKVEKIK